MLLLVGLRLFIVQVMDDEADNVKANFRCGQVCMLTFPVIVFTFSFSFLLLH